MADTDSCATRQKRMRRRDAPVVIGVAAVRNTAVIPAVIDGGGYGPGAGRCSKQKQGEE